MEQGDTKIGEVLKNIGLDFQAIVQCPVPQYRQQLGLTPNSSNTAVWSVPMGFKKTLCNERKVMRLPSPTRNRGVAAIFDEVGVRMCCCYMKNGFIQ